MDYSQIAEAVRAAYKVRQDAHPAITVCENLVDYIFNYKLIQDPELKRAFLNSEYDGQPEPVSVALEALRFDKPRLYISKVSRLYKELCKERGIPFRDDGGFEPNSLDFEMRVQAFFETPFDWDKYTRDYKAELKKVSPYLFDVNPNI